MKIGVYLTGDLVNVDMIPFTLEDHSTRPSSDLISLIAHTFRLKITSRKI
jgi:hypothetical protein